MLQILYNILFPDAPIVATIAVPVNQENLPWRYCHIIAFPDHRTGCGTARCMPSKRESIQNDKKVVSPLVAARLLLLCSPYQYEQRQAHPEEPAALFGLHITVPAGNCQYSPWPAPLSEPETFEKHATCHSTLPAGSEPWPSASAPAAAGNLRTRFHCSPPESR